ncbi:hypothetical protein KFE25_013623 [Diacronema lutheri]|uniref:Uncharacterized protein n=2 Tax=Diacronema lutheri TaxID=2081491 RepID=A0A8J5XV82_DIALT|nr:hypothetical protein KFE25_013623 [Diacronema lutheri]
MRRTTSLQLLADEAQSSPSSSPTAVRLGSMRHAFSFTTLSDLAPPPKQPPKQPRVDELVIKLSRAPSRPRIDTPVAPRAPKLRAVACDEMLAEMEPLALEPPRPSAVHARASHLLAPRAPKLLPTLMLDDVEPLSLPLALLQPAPMMCSGAQRPTGTRRKRSNAISPLGLGRVRAPRRGPSPILAQGEATAARLCHLHLAAAEAAASLPATS